MPNITISLPDPLKDFVDQQIAQRGFGNVSEYFRTLIRDELEKQRDERLQELLLEGLNSGEDIPLDANFWKELRTEAAEMLQERRRRKRRA